LQEVKVSKAGEAKQTIKEIEAQEDTTASQHRVMIVLGNRRATYDVNCASRLVMKNWMGIVQSTSIMAQGTKLYQEAMKTCPLISNTV
jgi:hypothetical protein